MQLKLWGWSHDGVPMLVLVGIKPTDTESRLK